MSEMEELVRQVVDRLTKDSVEAPPALQNNTGTATAADYPILQKHPDWVKTPDGRPVSQIDLSTVQRGEVENKDRPKWPRAPASRRWRKIFAVRPK